jgi:hypothetical protein
LHFISEKIALTLIKTKKNCSCYVGQKTRFNFWKSERARRADKSLKEDMFSNIEYAIRYI